LKHLKVETSESLNFNFYFQAFVVLGQFLVLKKNEDLFLEWLKDTAGISTNHARQCYQCLDDWCSAFL